MNAFTDLCDGLRSVRTLWLRISSLAVRIQLISLMILANLRLLSLTALEKWGLGPDTLRATNPGLIFTRISGYGQTGPWSPRPGYASVCEGEAGFRFINGFSDEKTGELSGPPVRPNISLGDSVAGLTAAFGTVLALFARRSKQDNGLMGGLTVDVSIMER